MGNTKDTRVLIVGAGFGGLAAARALRRAPVTITVIDRCNHHLFQPLLYQVATAALSPADIASPIRRILRGQSNISVILADATGVDVPAKRVILADGSVDYDILILATGATHAYFGHDAWSEHAPGLKSLKDALRIRQRVLLAFEVAEREPDPARRRSWMTFVIVGAGPTGVELAGTLAEVTRQTLARDFRHINTASARVILIEASPTVLGAYPPDLSDAARRPARESGRRRLDRSRGNRHRCRRRYNRPRADPCANRDLGRRRGRLTAGKVALCTARPRGPCHGPARPDHSRPR